jgi:hypothetical protein
MSAKGQKRRSSRPLVASGLPRLADDFGARRPWARTVLLTGLHSAGVTVHHKAAGLPHDSRRDRLIGALEYNFIPRDVWANA